MTGPTTPSRCWLHVELPMLSEPLHVSTHDTTCPESPSGHAEHLFDNDCLLVRAKPKGPIVPCVEMAIQTVHSTECMELWNSSSEDAASRNPLFSPLTCPKRRNLLRRRTKHLTNVRIIFERDFESLVHPRQHVLPHQMV